MSGDEPITRERLLYSYESRREAIRARLDEFAAIGREGDNDRLLEELAFCIFAAGTSARHGTRCVERIRPVLLLGDRETLRESLRGQRFYNLRSGFVHETRERLRSLCGLDLARWLADCPDREERRDRLVRDRAIMGIGMKEASHFLRNVGYRGYAILDKHIMRGLCDLGVVDSPERPSRPERYREIERRLHVFADATGIDADELDLLLWSERTGEILK